MRPHIQSENNKMILTSDCLTWFRDDYSVLRTVCTLRAHCRSPFHSNSAQFHATRYNNSEFVPTFRSPNKWTDLTHVKLMFLIKFKHVENLILLAWFFFFAHTNPVTVYLLAHSGNTVTNANGITFSCFIRIINQKFLQRFLKTSSRCWFRICLFSLSFSFSCAVRTSLLTSLLQLKKFCSFLKYHSTCYDEKCSFRLFQLLECVWSVVCSVLAALIVA